MDPAHDSVDLDNLFAFLSDVQSGRPANNVDDRMREIVCDFDEVHIAHNTFSSDIRVNRWFIIYY